MNQSSNSSSEPLKHVASSGPWPFISRHVLQHASGEQVVRHSRDHRKGLLKPAHSSWLRCLWMPEQLNWWIGIVFSLGALLFMLGSLLVLAPAIASEWSFTENTVNRIFLAGSIPFTIAAYLQLFQAANAGPFRVHGETTGRKRTLIFGWRPREVGWLSCALQFVGTLLFNINTFDATLPEMDWLQQDLMIWAPDFLGSILFLVSGYLAFIETCHAYWAWKTDSLSWILTFINFMGCVAFMISAFFAFVPASAPAFDAETLAVVFTFIGAVCFLVGSQLMLPEAAIAAYSEDT